MPKRLLLLLPLFLLSLLGQAQSYPVTISTQLTQPSPIYLNNYADATTLNSPIKVQLVLNDLSILNRQVRLKAYFKGNGIQFNTNDYVVGEKALYLEGGVPLQLTNIELAPYFKFQNLQGLNPNVYANALPEGIYEFCLEVYDVLTNKRLSRKSCVTTVIFQNDPPFLNLPTNKQEIMQQNIQNIVFSWTPRNINVSNVVYEFSLVEIWDNNTPVENAFLYSPPLYTTTVRNTILQYSINEPQLIPGKRYAWRVKAMAMANAEEIGVFKNNGYSAIFSFDYLIQCQAPLGIAAAQVSQDQAKITWSGALDNYDYEVKYRPKNANSDWYNLITPREYATLSNLKPKTTYEFSVGASCQKGKYTHSTLQQFTTLATEETTFAGCNLTPDPVDLFNQNLLPNLFANDVVKAGDFPIVVLKATGSNGRFSGEGYVTFAFLEKFRTLIDAADALGGDKIDISKFSRIKVKFDNIGVNTDFKLISGVINASYDKEWGSIVDGDKILNDVLGDNGKVVVTTLDFEVASITKNADGSTTITGTNGTQMNVPVSVNDKEFKDSKGQIIKVPANGKGESTIEQAAAGGAATAANTNGMSSGGAVTQISSADVVITFENDKDSKYAFDQQADTDTGTLKGTYETIPMKSGAVYKVGYKAVSDLNGEETFIAKATFKNGKTKDNIVFKTDKGAKVETEWIDAATAKITIKKTFDFAKESIIATVSPTTPKTEEPKAKDDIAGKVNIWHLSQKPINVTLVSVNGATIPAKAAEDLNTIYNKAGVLFSVKEENIRIDNLPNKIICGSSDLLNTYTLDQISITTAIRKALGSSYDKETYYMLYTGSTADNGVDGFMPLGRQYGFIFDNKNHTLAHELGHGALRLEHPFTEFKTTKGSTTLLMDYADGTKLDHNNWQSIHGGGWKPYLFQNDADGALAGGYGLAPDFSFVNNGDETTVANLNSVTEGFVGGFISNKATYKWENDKYIGTDGEIFETLKKEPELNTKIYLFYNNDQDCGKSNFLRTIYTEELQKIIKAEDNKKLVTFIKKYADNQSLQQKLKDENRVTYWGFVACNSNTSSSQTALIDCPTLPADFNKLDVDYLVNHFFASKSATCLATIPLEKRKELLKTMLKNWTVTSCLESESYPNSRIGNCYEPLVYKLILSTKTADEKALLDWFVSENVIFPLLDKTQFKTFDDIANKLNGWILSYYPMKGEVAVKNALEGSLKKIEFEENKVTASIQKEGIQLIREASGQCKECIPVSKIEITVAYNDYVLVHFKDNVGVFKAGTTARMPAIQALYLFNKDRRDLVITTSKVTFEVALLGLGVGEIGIAYDAYMTGRTAYAAYIGVKAMTDVGMGLGDIYIQNSLAEEWSNSPEGQKKLERWNTINKWYAVSTISLSGIDLAFQKYGRKITSTNAEEFLDEIEKGVNTAGNLVPSSLITKLNQNGATKLKTWTSGKSLNFVDDAGNVLTGANAEAKIFEKLESSIGSKTVLETTTDANGRLLVQTERGTNSNRVLSIETNKNGQVVVKEYAPSYKSTANTDIDVDLSKGMLAPDYTTKGGKYLYPKTSLQSGQKNVVEITMTGNMRNDFKAANEAAGFSSFGYDAPKRGDIQFTWHHLDDFNPVTGKVTAQLVDQSAHTKVVGMGHSGGVAQYKMFNGSGY